MPDSAASERFSGLRETRATSHANYYENGSWDISGCANRLLRNRREKRAVAESQVARNKACQIEMTDSRSITDRLVNKRMKTILNHPVGLRLTDDEWERIRALKIAMGFPSLPNTTLCHDLVVAGLVQAETKRKRAGKATSAGKQARGRSKRRRRRTGRRISGA
jgi:hypothetical protein